ncbi:MAG: ComF family protein [Geminicoccaceae bacterium]|nr:ComF family protein [Geminicoccaceae bacterium]
MAPVVGSAGAHRALSLARLAGRRLLETVLPARCLACGCMVERQGTLCHDCWSDVAFVTGTVCRHCGLPMQEAGAVAPLCDHCLDEPPAYETARAALRYRGTARRLILAFKHGDRIEGARTFARWMASAGGPMLEGRPSLVPVPLHRWRLVARGYNQSAVLAAHLAAHSRAIFLPDTLSRPQATISQQGLRAHERKENVTAAAFAVAPGRRTALEGRSVVLIDDVLTTGATVSACAQVLLRAGAARVDVLTLARVAQDEQVLI